MSFEDEFCTVDLIVGSTCETRGVDAFALSLIKAERQMRKLVTYLVYQSPCFSESDISDLRGALGKKHNGVYFSGLENGFNAIYERTIQDLVGNQYAHLRGRIAVAIDWRNKIFHGQLTPQYLSRDDLLGMVGDIRSWCKLIAENAAAEFGYDGFLRDSFRKSVDGAIAGRFRLQVNSVDEYLKFIGQYMKQA